MHNDLKRLIDIAGQALEQEDRFVLGAITANQKGYPDGKGGILRINNERYYQFIVARALMSSFPYSAAVEVEGHDLILRYPGEQSKWFAVVEMKRWMSEDGLSEQPGIKKDIEKLLEKLRQVKAERAMMLIFSANPLKSTEGHLGELAKELGITTTEDSNAWKWYPFPTINREGESVEFFVAGYEVLLLPESAAENTTYVCH
jgi:hypothetical protein